MNKAVAVVVGCPGSWLPSSRRARRRRYIVDVFDIVVFDTVESLGIVSPSKGAFCFIWSIVVVSTSLVFNIVVSSDILSLSPVAV
ncbi:MAG: hypothetical protein M0Z67_04200 [Nitrospiraceae bacterium]|nr:hypothetical protein [Nitrospiraceae bacterium]